MNAPVRVMSWPECAAAGMTVTQAAQHRGKTVSAGSLFAKRHGLAFAKDNSDRAERFRKLHADPEFNPLAALTSTQRADCDTLRKKGGYTRAEALAAVGAVMTPCALALMAIYAIILWLTGLWS